MTAPSSALGQTASSTAVRADGPSVVALGGGHGTAVTLRAARRYAGQVTAVVSVADDGGSSGRLRKLLNVVALGDLRMCLVALAAEDSALARAFEHRFEEGELAGHALGNLILAGLVEATGDLVTGVQEAADLLGAAGDVLPATVERVVLKAESEGGQVAGQVAVSRAGNIHTVSLVPGDSQAPAARRRADTGGRPDRHRSGVALHQCAGRGRRGGDRRRRGPLVRAARLRVQLAPATARDGRFRRSCTLGGLEQA